MQSAIGWATVAVVALAAWSCGGSTSGGSATCDGGLCPGGGGIGATGATGTGATGTGATGTGAMGGLGATGGTGGAPQPGTAHPPAPDPSAPPASGSQPTTLAIDKLALGDTDMQGNPDVNAWRKLGHDIDGLASTKNDWAHCKPQPGATKASVQTDGEGGIDNSYGSNLMPIMSSLTADVSAQINEQIMAGGSTPLFHLQNLASGPPSQNGIVAAIFNAAPLGSPPAWNGTDVRPVTAESVNGGNISSPKLAAPSSYLVGGTWVSGAAPLPGPWKLDLSSSQGADTFATLAPIRHIRVTFVPNGTASTATATSGIVSGVIIADELVAELKKVAGALDPNLCEGATFDSIAQQIKAAADIMADGTNGDPSKTCDGISIGIGFTARAVQLGSVAAPVVPPPDPCVP